MYGCKKEIKDTRDFKLKKISKTVQIPDTYTIKMPNVKNQGAVSSCVAHTLASYLEEFYKDKNKQFSVRIHIWLQTKWIYTRRRNVPKGSIKNITKSR